VPVINSLLPAPRKIAVGIPAIRQPVRLLERPVVGTTPGQLHKTGEGTRKPDSFVPPSFQGIDAFGHTQGEITFSALDFLSRQLGRVPDSSGIPYSGPSARLPGPPVFFTVNTREQFKLFPPFIGAEAGYETVQLLPTAKGSPYGPRLLITYNSIDVGIGFKGKAVVPPLGLTKEFSIIPLLSEHGKFLRQYYPEELGRVLRGGFGPIITREELLRRDAFIEAAILFPALQGRPISFLYPDALPDFPLPTPPRSTVTNPHDC